MLGGFVIIKQAHRHRESPSKGEATGVDQGIRTRGPFLVDLIGGSNRRTRTRRRTGFKVEQGFLASIWRGPAVPEQEKENPTVRGVSFRDHRRRQSNQIREGGSIKGGSGLSNSIDGRERERDERLLFSGPRNEIKDHQRSEKI